MRNFTKLANLHRVFFKRADEKTFAPGHFSPDVNKPGPGNLDAQAAHATSKANAQNAADDRAMRANYNVTPTPGSASGHEVMTPKRNLGISPNPPKPGPVTTYKNQGLTPKPFTPPVVSDDSYSDYSFARNSRSMQREAQRNLASPYGHLQSNGEVLQGFRYPHEMVEPGGLNVDMDFGEKTLGNLPKLPPREEARVNNLQ